MAGGLQRLDVLLIVLGEHGALGHAGGGIVAHHAQVLRGPVDVRHEQVLLVGLPADVREVLVQGLTRLQEHRVARSHVMHADGHVVTGLPRHRVADGLEGAGLGADVLQHVGGHHRFIHAVEGELSALGPPEQALLHAVFLPVHALPVHDAVSTIGGDGRGLVLALSGAHHHDVVVLHEGHGTRAGLDFLMTGPGFDPGHGLQFGFREVVGVEPLVVQEGEAVGIAPRDWQPCLQFRAIRELRIDRAQLHQHTVHALADVAAHELLALHVAIALRTFDPLQAAQALGRQVGAGFEDGIFQSERGLLRDGVARACGNCDDEEGTTEELHDVLGQEGG